MTKKTVGLFVGLLLANQTLLAEVLNKQITLDEAIKIALENSEKHKISNVDLQIAEAQYTQAMSANYPSFDLELGAVKRDEDIVNITNGSFALPDGMSTLLQGVAEDQIAAQIAALPPEYQAAALAQAQAELASTDLSTLPLEFESIVYGDEMYKGSLKMTYPLYTGGKVSALQKQAKLGKEIASEKDKRSNQEITFDVKKYYHGALLAEHVASLVEDTYQRLDLLNDLTKEMYEGGSENVKKTDYYRTQLAASMLKAISTEMKANVKLAKSALVFAMGVDPKSELSLDEIAYNKTELSAMDSVLDQAYNHNSELMTLTKALEVYDAKIDEAKSAYKPNIGLFGSVDRSNSNFNGGMSNAQNDTAWQVGVGASWNLFNGFRTTGEVDEAKLNKLKLKEQYNMLKNGLALQVKKAYLETQSNADQIDVLKETVNTAEANRDLNTRAYQADMAETKDVVEAQITEAQIKAKYLKSLHDYALSAANLDLVTGK